MITNVGTRTEIDEFIVCLGVSQVQDLQISIFANQRCGAKMRTVALMTLTSASPDD